MSAKDSSLCQKINKRKKKTGKCAINLISDTHGPIEQKEILAVVSKIYAQIVETLCKLVNNCNKRSMSYLENCLYTPQSQSLKTTSV